MLLRSRFTVWPRISRLQIPLIAFRFALLSLAVTSRWTLLVMLNVLEHIENDVQALKKAFNLLKPGGVLIIEVPASPGLYGAYDRQLRHFRRYSAPELYGKLASAGFTVRRKSHLGFILFPAFAAVKLWDKIFSSGKDKTVGTRSRREARPVMPLVKWALEFESKYLSDVQLPFGISSSFPVAVKDR